MAASTTVHCIYRPLHGLSFAVVFHVPGLVVDPNNAAVQAVVTAINLVTRAVCIEITLGVVHENTASALSAAAYTSGDKFLLIARDDNDKAHNFKIPGVKPSLISADKETILLTVTPASDWVAAVTTYARTPGGENVSSAIEGYRSENRKPIKGSGVIIAP